MQGVPIEEMFWRFMKEFMEKKTLASSARFFTADGEIIVDKVHWASFTLENAGDDTAFLFNRAKTLVPGGIINFGSYFNFSMRADRIPFTFEGVGVNPRLELVYDQYLPNYP